MKELLIGGGAQNYRTFLGYTYMIDSCLDICVTKTGLSAFLLLLGVAIGLIGSAYICIGKLIMYAHTLVY